MACTSYLNVDELNTEDESIQALARKLPEGDALPDGFSESFTAVSSNDVSVMPSKALSTLQGDEISSNHSDGFSKTNIESSRVLQNSPEELTHRLELMSSCVGNDACAKKLIKEDTLNDEYSEHLTSTPRTDESASGILNGSFTHKDERGFSEKQCGLSEMDTECTRVSDNLQEEFPHMPGRASCSAEGLLIAQKLPEGDALPDGFSECFTDVPDESHLHMKESSTLNENIESSQLKTESSKDMVAVHKEFPDMDGVADSLCGSELLASGLPEGDVLPDGFSESFTEPGDDTSAIHLSKESSTSPVADVSTGKSEVGLDLQMERCRILGGLPEKFHDADRARTSLSAGSQNSLFESSDKAVEVSNGSPSSSSSEKNQDRRGKLRRFPVQLSEKESSHHSGEAVGCDSESHGENSERVYADHEFSSWSNMNETLLTNLQTDSLNATDVPNSEVPQDMYYKLCMYDRRDSSREETARTVQEEEAEPRSATLLEDSGTCKTVLLTEEVAEVKDNHLETIRTCDTTSMKDEIFNLHNQNEQLRNDLHSTHADLSKSVLIREKLESLCRELQRQNKQLSDECKKIASEEQQKRVDLSVGFHAAIKDVTIKLEEQGDHHVRQMKENEMLQEKLRHFTQQYEFWEQQYSQQLRTKALEQQVLELKLKQQEELSKQGEAKIQVYTEQIVQLLKTEQDLRGRLALYGEKFQQFQDTLTKSNEVFASFKMEMEKMSKTVKKLEKENLSLKKKNEKSDVSIIELVDERELLRKQLDTARHQKEKLEALCRVLQTERKQQNVATGSGVAPAADLDSASVAASSKSEQE